MVSEVKFVTISTKMDKSDMTPAHSNASIAKNAQSDVLLSHNLEKLVNSMISEENHPLEQTRMMHVKQQIQSNTYSIDTDLLTEKLYHNLFSTSIGG